VASAIYAESLVSDRIRPRGVLPLEGLERRVRLADVQELKKNGIAIARRSEHGL